MEKTRFKEWLRTRYSAADRRKFLFVYPLIAFPVIQMAIFWFYVNLSGIAMAFQDAAGNWSFDSINKVLTALSGRTDQFGFNLPSMIGKSVFIWVLNNTLLEVVSLFLTFILAKHMIGAKFFRIAYMAPGLLGTVLTVSIWKNLYAYDGPIIKLLTDMGIELPFFAIRNGLLGAEETAFATLIIKNIIYVAGGGLIMTGAYLRIPEEIFESAKLEGCGLLREMFQIALPCAWPTFSTMMIFSLCSVFTSDISTWLYSNGTGARGINSMGFYLQYLNLEIASGRTSDYSYVSAVGMVISLITIPFVIAGRKLLTRIGDTQMGF